MSTTARHLQQCERASPRADWRLAFFDLSAAIQCRRSSRRSRVSARGQREHRRALRRAGRRPRSWSSRTARVVLGCSAGETAFGQSMTALNFLFTRARKNADAGTRSSSPRWTTTPTSHPGSSRARPRRRCPGWGQPHRRSRADYDAAWPLSDARRGVPVAANSVGTAPTCEAVVDRASVDALAGPMPSLRAAATDVPREVDVLLLAVQVSAHMGLAFGKQELLVARLRANRRQATTSGIGSSQDEPARAARGLWLRSTTLARWDAVLARACARRALPRSTAGRRRALRAAHDDACPDLLLQRPGHSAEHVATFSQSATSRLARRLHAVETMKHPGRRRRGARGHRALQLRDGLTGCSTGNCAGVRPFLPAPRFLGRGIADARTRPRRHVLQSREDEPELYPEVERSSATAEAIWLSVAAPGTR